MLLRCLLLNLNYCICLRLLLCSAQPLELSEILLAASKAYVGHYYPTLPILLSWCHFTASCLGQCLWLRILEQPWLERLWKITWSNPLWEREPRWDYLVLCSVMSWKTPMMGLRKLSWLTIQEAQSPCPGCTPTTQGSHWWHWNLFVEGNSSVSQHVLCLIPYTQHSHSVKQVSRTSLTPGFPWKSQRHLAP